MFVARADNQFAIEQLSTFNTTDAPEIDRLAVSGDFVYSAIRMGGSSTQSTLYSWNDRTGQLKKLDQFSDNEFDADSDDLLKQHAALNGRLVFSARDAGGTFGNELWGTDGESVWLVQDLASGSSDSGPTAFAVSDNGRLYFLATISDGTGPKVRLFLTDSNPGSVSELVAAPVLSVSADPVDLDGFQGLFAGSNYFMAVDDSSGAADALKLLAFDGISVSELTTVDPSGDGRLDQLTELDSQVGTVAFHVRQSGSGSEIYVSDGTAGRTLSLNQLSPFSGSATNLVTLGGDLFFLGPQAVGTGSDLWYTDTTENTVERVLDREPIPGTLEVSIRTDEGDGLLTGLDFTASAQLVAPIPPAANVATSPDSQTIEIDITEGIREALRNQLRQVTVRLDSSDLVLDIDPLDSATGLAITWRHGVRADIIDANGGLLEQGIAAIDIREVPAGDYYLRVFNPHADSQDEPLGFTVEVMAPIQGEFDPSQDQDLVRGGENADILIGNEHIDRLFGNSGDDVFVAEKVEPRDLEHDELRLPVENDERLISTIYYDDNAALAPVFDSAPCETDVAVAITPMMCFPDGLLRAWVADELDIPTFTSFDDDVTYDIPVRPTDMSRLWQADLSSAVPGLGQLNGLQYATNLLSLNLADMPGLGSIEILTPSRTNDLYAHQTGLTHLHRLILDDDPQLFVGATSTETWSTITELTFLEVLSTRNSLVTSLPSLDALGELSFLDLSDNSLEGVLSLDGLESLEVLDLSNNAITSIAPLSGTFLQDDGLENAYWSSIGPWQRSIELHEDSRDSDYHFLPDGVSTAAMSGWTFRSLPDGEYAVLANWPADDQQSTDAIYAINPGASDDADKILDIKTDQSLTLVNGEWNSSSWAPSALSGLGDWELLTESAVPYLVTYSGTSLVFGRASIAPSEQLIVTVSNALADGTISGTGTLIADAVAVINTDTLLPDLEWIDLRSNPLGNNAFDLGIPTLLERHENLDVLYYDNQAPRWNQALGVQTATGNDVDGYVYTSAVPLHKLVEDPDGAWTLVGTGASSEILRLQGPADSVPGELEQILIQTDGEGVAEPPELTAGVFNGDSKFFVADRANDRIISYDAGSGNQLRSKTITSLKPLDLVLAGNPTNVLVASEQLAQVVVLRSDTLAQIDSHAYPSELTGATLASLSLALGPDDDSANGNDVFLAAVKNGGTIADPDFSGAVYRLDSSGASEGQTLIPGSDPELTAPLDIAFDASGRVYVIDMAADGQTYRLLRYMVGGSGTASFESELISPRSHEWAPSGGRVRIQFFKEPADETGAQWLQLTDPYAGTIETYVITDSGATQVTLFESGDIGIRHPTFAETTHERYTFEITTSDPAVTATVLPSGKLELEASSTFSGIARISVTAIDGAGLAGDFRGRSASMAFDLVVAADVATGSKFEDLDGNGLRHPNEPGLAHWTIFRDDDLDGVIDVDEPFVVTDAHGDYLFTELETGPNFLREVNSEAMVQTAPSTSSTLTDVAILCADFNAESADLSSLDGFTASAASGAADIQWHASSYRFGSTSDYSAYFGNDATHSYYSDSGTVAPNPEVVSGTFTSPDIDLTHASAATLKFRSFLEVDDTTDVARVTVTDTDGNALGVVAATRTAPNNLANQGLWKTVELSLDSYLGQTVQLVFEFDTVDTLENGYEGWFVDDIQVLADFDVVGVNVVSACDHDAAAVVGGEAHFGNREAIAISVDESSFVAGRVAEGTSIPIESVTAVGIVATSYDWNIQGPRGIEIFATKDISFTPPIQGRHRVRLKVTDDNGNIYRATRYVVAIDVAPQLDLGANLIVGERERLDRDLQVVDPGEDDDWIVTLDYGDGSAAVVHTLSSHDFSLDHVYQKPGSYTITGTVQNPEGQHEDTLLVTVVGVAPTVAVSIAGPLDEGGLATATVTITDPQSLTDPTWWNPASLKDWKFQATWSDGTSESCLPDSFANDVATATLKHPLLDQGGDDGGIEVTVVDRDGDVADLAIDTVLLNNKYPENLSVSLPETIGEGKLFTANVSSVDAGDDSLTYEWDFGDGSAPQAGQSIRYAFGDNGDFDVTVAVTDADGAKTETTQTIAVTNSAPTIELVDDLAAEEGVLLSGTTLSYTDSGRITYLSGTETFTYEIDFGDGSDIQSGSVTDVTDGSQGQASSGRLPFSHIYADNGSYQATVTITDDDGDSDSTTIDVVVANKVPTLVTEPTLPAIDEGQALSSIELLAFADSGFGGHQGNSVETFDYTIDWGDGEKESGQVTGVIDGSEGQSTTGSVSGSHGYADSGLHTITVTVTDDDGGQLTRTLPLVVNNVAPSLDSMEPTVIPAGGRLYLDTSFTDPGADDWDIRVDWNREGEKRKTVDHTAKRVQLNERYTAPGEYNVRVTVTDDDFGTANGLKNVLVTSVWVSLDDDPAGAGKDLVIRDVVADGNTDTILLTTETRNIDGVSTAGLTVSSGATSRNGVDPSELVGSDIESSESSEDSTEVFIPIIEIDGDTILIDLGAGDDTLIIADIPDTVGKTIVVLAGAGDDLIDATGVESPVSIIGGDGNDIIIGGDGNDTVDAGAGDDCVVGNSGDDLIIDGPGNDIYEAGAGADHLEASGDVNMLLTDISLTRGGGGGPIFDTNTISGFESASLVGGISANDLSAVSFSGSTTIEGGSGDDTITGSIAGGLLKGGPGNDRLTGGINDDIIHGGNGDDFLNARGGGDVLYGGTGNDNMNGGTGADYLDGGIGNDFVKGQGSTGDTVKGGLGDDILDGGDGTDILYESGNVNFTLTTVSLTGMGHDTVVGIENASLDTGKAPNRVDTSAFPGGVTVNVSGGNDTVNTGPGHDRILGGGGNDVIDSGDGNDLVRGQGGHDQINGGPGNDKLFGDANDDNVVGGEGDDLFIIGSGTDHLSGGEGNDQIYVRKNTDMTLDDSQLVANGTDLLDSIEAAFLRDGNSSHTLDTSGFSGNATVIGLNGDDTITTGSGADSIDAGDGDDVIDAGGGTDTVRGRDGNDNIAGGAGDDDLNGDSGDDVIDGGDGNDLIDGGEGNNSLAGSGGGDLITAGSGSDIIDGGDDDDTITAGGGDDQVNGGDGSDLLIESAIAGDVTITDVAVTGTDSDTIASIEQIDLTGDDSPHFFDARNYTGDVIFRGGAGDDILAGGSGNDKLLGYGGNDILAGFAGDDTFNGSGGDDSILGGDGADNLSGGGGNDQMVGQGDDDKLNGQGGTDKMAGGSGGGADSGDVLVGSAGEIDEAFALNFADLIGET